MYIYIDLEKALKGGIPFFVSENKVVLSPGNERGYIPATYFQRVVDGKTRQLLARDKIVQ